MKPILYLLLTITIIFAACKKSGQSPQNNVSFTFKGKQYSIANPAATYTSAAMFASGKKGSTSVNLYVFAVTPGTYTMGQQSAFTFAIDTALADIYTIKPGTLTLSSFDTKGATGTFSGMAGHLDGLDTTSSPISGTFNLKF